MSDDQRRPDEDVPASDDADHDPAEQETGEHTPVTADEPVAETTDEAAPDDGSASPIEVVSGRSGGHRRRRRRGSGCLPILLVLLLVGGGGYVAWQQLDVGNPLDRLSDYLNDTAEDYAGPGEGRVVFEVSEGDTIAEMGRNLVADDVVASVQAFTEAAAARDEESRGIQVGFYQLQRQMAARDVVDVLVDPANLVADVVTVPEGLTVDQIVDVLAKNTDYGKKAFRKALRKPERLGLPDYADGEAEGYLFPATYSYGPNASALDMLTAMVDRWRQAADDAGLEDAADELGYTPHELMTVASLVQAEGRGDDMPKVARVIYNRLENPGTAGTVGLLQIDAAVNYALGQSPIARLTTDQIESVADSPYNTYTQTGLPPGPIEAPGDEAIAAAANPEEGDWYYYVTVNLATGETKFAETPEEFSQFRAELDQYCATQSDRC
ncbi:MAG: aminodeoxychorismate lyase [Nocardioides sp.]|nr:aminodeoxychorismate lyase [Nocardioides sp.]